jgi:hypothetical protein
MDKPKIELCGDNDPDCEMGNMKVRALGIRAGQALCSPPCVCVGSAPACLLVLSWQVTSSICVMCIFVLSGLGLKTDDIKTALVQVKGIGYAFASINFMTGMVAFVMVALPFERAPPSTHAHSTPSGPLPWSYCPRQQIRLAITG